MEYRLAPKKMSVIHRSVLLVCKTYTPYYHYLYNTKRHKCIAKNISILVNCAWGSWDTWATCSKTCGGGVQVRTRKVETHEENGGTVCSGLSSEQQNCNTGTCPAGNDYHCAIDAKPKN